jgi:predicted nuclease of predicted toxin-antitoxin system
MIRLLADENFPSKSVDFLRANGYDVLWILKSHQGISDSDIIHLANAEKRLILTFDRDFGQLIYKEGLIPFHGVLYFRLQNFLPEEPGQIAQKLLTKSDLKTFRMVTVIEEKFIRQKKF